MHSINDDPAVMIVAKTNGASKYPLSYYRYHITSDCLYISADCLLNDVWINL